jgi:hypothetical protein
LRSSFCSATECFVDLHRGHVALDRLLPCAVKEELVRHRTLLEKWIKETDDQGQDSESDASLMEVLNQWKKACVNPEYDRIRK